MRQQINFYAGKVRGANAISPLVIMVISVCVALAVCVNWGWQQQKQLTLTQSQLDSVKQELDAAQLASAKYNTAAVPIPIDGTLDAAISLLEQKVKLREALAQTIEAQLTPKSVAISPLFIALSKHHRDGLWLNTVRIQRAQGIISIHGKTVNPALVSTYLARLIEDKNVTQTGFNYLRLALPEDTETKPGTAQTSDFIITTDEDEMREDDETEIESQSAEGAPKDFFKDSFKLINQLKMLSQ